MQARQHTVSTFELPGVPLLYDLLVRTLYLPVGGERSLRNDAVSRLAIARTARVLELGCGTGSFTQRFLARGAQVLAVDGSARMIARARRKAPDGVFQQADLRTYRAPPEGGFDLVFFGFVLHEFERPARVALLREAAGAIGPSGRIAIVDHAVPGEQGPARAWRRFLNALEPPSVREILEDGYASELHEANLRVNERVPLARGLATLILAKPHPS